MDLTNQIMLGMMVASRNRQAGGWKNERLNESDHAQDDACLETLNDSGNDAGLQKSDHSWND